MIDPHSFREFEHSGWQGIPEQYHQAFGELTTQSIEPLLDAAGVKAGTKVIDVASGPGYVAAAAARRGATVIGVDFSAAMVAEAQRRNPEIEFREGDAEQLPLGDAFFDAAVMNFGILHLARPDQALAEACRVLCTDGRFGFTAWAKPEEAVGFGIVLRSIAATAIRMCHCPKARHSFVSVSLMNAFDRCSQQASNRQRWLRSRCYGGCRPWAACLSL
jgi:ubiquinone/menaquinone biosynthesis C-methylase UbiE